MVRVAISVEGTTEERFVSRLLRPHFIRLGIYIEPINMNGNINIDRVTHELNNLIYSFDYVTTLYDFYGFKGIKEGETKESLEERISDNLRTTYNLDSEKLDKVIPYIQMHEFEGLLFSCPETISRHLQNQELERWSGDILRKFHNDPESINNSKDTAPSKRLRDKTNYRKTTHGPNIAEDIGLEGLRSKCKGFNEWICKIENLNKKS